MKKKLANKDINLLIPYKKKPNSGNYLRVLKYLALPVIASVIFLGIFGYTQLQINVINKETAKIKKDTKVLEKKIAEDPKTELNKLLTSTGEDAKKYVTFWEDIESYPKIRQGTFDGIIIAAGTTVSVQSLAYTRDSQVITLQVEAAGVSEVEYFVRNLKEAAIFQAVDYSGYAQTEKSDGTTTESTTKDVTEGTTNKESDAAQAILDALKKTAEKDNASTKGNTKKVYSATVLCQLK